ncbi:hypothetical protein [Nonlabens xiamenensis]|uniref:hypothetical protein n=1 Tax=Nonlabens xiamenensis TaxID=2341043 RepID=UPI000F6055A6|nr:hypothetical protein [Nonlabens xiamenensis]
MIDRFLNAKHWQLFLLTFGIPMIFQFIIMGIMSANIGAKNNPAPDFMFSYMKFFPIMMLLFMGVFFGWFWSVAIGLQRVIPDEIKLKVNSFKIFLLIPIVYMIFFLGFIMTSFTSGGHNPGIFAVIVPLHLFSMFCIFYSLYFVAKTFKTAELQRKVIFSDFAGEFFMIWFYPIGIWIVQPKLNKMIKEKAHTANNV